VFALLTLALLPGQYVDDAAFPRARQKAAVDATVRIAHPATKGEGSGVVVLYEAAEHGGELVYAYAGGVGIRSGNPEDVSRLLVAGLYNESQVARKAGKGEDANRLVRMLLDRNPGDPTTRLMWAESLLLDVKNPAGALAALDSTTVRPDDARLRPRRDMLVADALRQMGRTDSARVVLQTLTKQFPANVRVRAKLDSLGGEAQ